MPDFLPESSDQRKTLWARLSGLARWVITAWALVGGALLLLIVLLTVYSTAGNLLFAQPMPGDFEMVQVGVAVAAFTFLPYCELTGANVTADLFTAKLGPRPVAALGAVASLLSLGIAGVLAWRMYHGLLDFQEYEETTGILQFPIWIAFLPILVSLGLLILAASIRSVETSRDMVRGNAKRG